MAAYLVKKNIRMLGTGLERLPGQHVTDADFRTCPGWRDALLQEGAIENYTPTAPKPAPVTNSGFGQALVPVMARSVEDYEIPETPAEQRRRKRGA